jgi:hypothetical protein
LAIGKKRKPQRAPRDFNIEVKRKPRRAPRTPRNFYIGIKIKPQRASRAQGHQGIFELE